MFKKKPQIKNLSPLRSSDRRKLADQIIADYHIPVPSNAPADNSEALPESSEQQASSAPTLTSIRTSLIPEQCLSARFTTHSGPNAVLVSGTIYVGAHPGQEERILWLQYGKDARLYPTMYTCWQNPGLVPLLHALDFVVEKLKSGADLMTPGLVGGPPWPEGAKEGSVVAVAGLEKASVPVWVGVCKIDISGLGRVQGLKGAAVEGIHWAGDEVYNWSQTGSGGRAVPDHVEGWDLRLKEIENGMKELVVEDDDEDDVQEDGGVALEASASNIKNGQTSTNGNADGGEEPEYEPTTAEIDHAFHQAFLSAIYHAKKSNPPPTYGIPLPIQPSYLIANIIQPNLRYQSAHYNIKKTSWKNVKKFIKHLDRQVLVKSKDRNGGETVILDVDFDDAQITNFAPYKLPKPKAPEGAPDSSTPNTGADPSLNQTLNLLTYYRASSKLVPDLVPSKTDYYTSTQISNFLKTYIANNPSLTTNTSSKRFIKLDPFIANNILSTQNANDTKSLATGEIARDALQKRVLEDANLCIPHWVLLHNADSLISTLTSPDFTTDLLSQHNLKPKPYPAPHILLTLEKRSGTKTVTKISGLEIFHINPVTFGPELARKCAGSASVGQLMGGKPGTMEVVVQGDQRDVVTKEVGRRGVKGEWVEVVDKSKGKKKK
jgi:translation initiation factor 2D